MISAEARRGPARRAPVVTCFTAEDENLRVHHLLRAQGCDPLPPPQHCFTCVGSPVSHGLPDRQRGQGREEESLSTYDHGDCPDAALDLESEGTQDPNPAPVLASRDRISELPE